MISSSLAVSLCNDKNKKYILRWTRAIVNDLITCLGIYRKFMDYRGKYFEGDRPGQYVTLQEEMGNKFFVWLRNVFHVDSK